MQIPYSMQRMTSYDDPVSVQGSNIRLRASRGSLVPSKRFQQHHSAGAVEATTTSQGCSAATSKSTPESNESSSSPESSLQDKVIIVMGGGGGGSHELGATMAEALVQRGATAHCLGVQPEPYVDTQQIQQQQQRADKPPGGALHYHQADVRDSHALRQSIADIAAAGARIDGLVAAGAADVQRLSPAPALKPGTEGIKDLRDIEYTAVLTAVQEVGTQMVRFKTPGSIVLVASMKPIKVDTVLTSSTHNSGRPPVDQLTKTLGLEWAKDGIRVNSLRPGYPPHPTPMVAQNIQEEPWAKDEWEEDRMIATPKDFRGLATFLISNASSYLTGASLVIDGGQTA